MKTPIKKLISIALSAVMTASMLTAALSVNAAETGKVRVIVRNDTYSVDDGAEWGGVLIDEETEIADTADALSTVVNAIDNAGFSCEVNTTQWGSYISEVNGISESDAADYSGWMGIQNDWVVNDNLAHIMLNDGDTFELSYSVTMGADIGADWANPVTTLKSLEFEGAALNSEFTSSCTEYTITLNEGVSKIKVLPTADNRNYQVRIYNNEYTPEQRGYRKTDDIEVKTGDTLYIGVGNENWPGSYPEETVYKVHIVDELTHKINEKFETTAEYLLSCPIPQVSSVGGEWMVIGLARSGKITEQMADGYYKNVIEYVEQNGSSKLHRSKSTENSRVILALTAIGKDVTNVAGYNLLEPLADFDFLKKQGINGPIWALIALDSLQYEIPVDGSVANQTTREKLINYILDSEAENGGWSLSGISADPDMTGMAIQALAPYYKTDSRVQEAVDSALNVMSNIQHDDGGFSSFGSGNPESCAQIIVAETSLGINPTDDERFTKNNISVVDNMLSFSVENGFEHLKNIGYNQMATEQCFYALASLIRLNNEDTALYDMTDLLPKYDANLDGSVDITDATLVQKFIGEIETPSLQQQKIADVNRNGIIEITDVTEIQKYIAAY